MKRYIIAIALFVLIFAVYIFVSGKFIWRVESTNFSYFNLLAESLLNRKYDLIHPPANPFDLAVYKGAVYLPWGPFPAVMILPLVKLFGIEVSDRIYTAFFGAINAVLLYMLLLEMKKLIKNISFFHIFLLTLFFAFGTVHFASSTIARVWFTSQILSLTMYLFSLLNLFIFLRTKNSLYFFVSIAFLAFSIMGRLWYVMMMPMYIYTIWISQLNKRKYLFLVLGSLFIAAMFIRMYGLYNYRRFGFLFETGYNYQNESEQFVSLRNTYGRYNISFFLKNVWHQLLKPVSLSNTFPFINPDFMGNGIFATSPLLLLIFFFKKIKKYKLYLKLFVIGILPYVIQLMFFFGTGYKQFGARYLLDVVPLMIMVLALIIPYINKKLVYGLFTISIIINSLGAAWLVFSY